MTRNLARHASLYRFFSQRGAGNVWFCFDTVDIATEKPIP
ncbi:hypothetical protein V5J35_004574 [Endozoicomonas sp. NE40]|uniref:Uncharacterized protein n=1 Tax=Endozoicomonas lisbonensis TaxID=3120522 RepID=A0ABV2SNN8_9GAMM